MKSINTILVFSIITIFLFGCSGSKTTLTIQDYTLSDDASTSKNISIGSSSSEFIKAYNGYISNVMYNNDGYSEREDINKIDYSDFCYVYLPTIFIDDKPYSVDEFMKNNNVDNGLDSWFAENPEYLEKHSAIYRCLVFTFENDEVIYIQSLEKSYNEE